MPKNEPRWHSRVDGAAFVSHWTITPAELDRLAELRHLTLWNVRFPAGFRFADLSALELLDIRGGSRSQLDYLEGAVTLRGRPRHAVASTTTPRQMRPTATSRTAPSGSPKP